MYSEALLRAHRVLLERPTLRRAEQREEYGLVSRYVEALEAWHRERTGWPIYHNERAGVIRLRRRPSLAPSGSWEPWKADIVLSSPRDYACLVYLLWYARSPMVLGRGGLRQVLLSDLSNHVAQRSTLLADRLDGDVADRVEPFDFARRRADYYSLRRALKALEDLGALIIVDEARSNPGTDAVGEALIEFTDVVEALIVEVDPRPLAILDERRPDPLSLSVPILDEATSVPLRRAWRGLLLGPVLLRRDDPAAFEALVSHRNDVGWEGERIFGFALELTAHYARFVRPSGSSVDRVSTVLNVQQRGLVHAGLLLCSSIRRQIAAGLLPYPDENGCLVLDWTTLTLVFREVCELNRHAWGSGLAEVKVEVLLDRVCDVLRAAGLLRGPDSRRAVLVLPTAALYQVQYGGKVADE